MVTGCCGQLLWTVFTLVIFSEFDKNLIVLFEAILTDCILPLELLELRVPAHVALGTRAALSCRWALGPADVLYSVKWYKDGKEFFRHVPRDHEPRRKFPLPGVDVETQQSDASGSSLMLSAAVSETGGRYRCEVSGERPLFPTVSGYADLNVVVLPEHGPFLSGLRSRYRLGDRVQVNCTSGRSRPSNHLSWYINGEPAPTTAVLPSIHRTYEDLQTTTLLLDFILTEQHFKSNGFRVKCLATVASLYWRSNEESALLEKGKVYDKLTPFTPETNTRADRVHSNLAGLLIGSSTSIHFMLLAVFCIRL